MTANKQQDQTPFGPIQIVGCVGMLVCLAVALGLLIVTGGYTLSTGEPLRLPILEIGATWIAVLGICEVMAFGWRMMWLVLLVAGSSMLTFLTLEVLGL